MPPSRRAFLKLIATGVLGYGLDVDRLLWVKGERTIFIPSSTLTLSEIVAAELASIAPKLSILFERDDVFYKALSSKFLD